MSHNNARPSGRAWDVLVLNVRARGEPCCRCGQRIDYGLNYPDPNAFSVDHFPYPISTHPWMARDPANLHAAHLRCNQSAGNGRRPTLSLGEASEAW